MSETVAGTSGEITSYFQVLERPSVHPGRCLVCGNTQRPVVMLKVEVDYADLGYGALLLCEFCVKEAASRFPDDSPPPRLLSYKTHEEAIRRSREEMADELRDLADRFAGISDDSAVPVYGSSDSVPEQTEPEDPASTERDIPEVDRAAVKTNRNSSKQGSTSLSSDSGDGSGSFLGLSDL